jgi:hypothetical protein
MGKEQRELTKEEERQNHIFSFMVGIFIAMAVIALFVLLFH